MRQVQPPQALELLAPVLELVGELPVPEPAPLPARVVRVLHRQRNEPDVRFSQRLRPVQGVQLRGHHPHRPAVRHDVVHGQYQEVITWAPAHKASPEHGPLTEIEGDRDLLGQDRRLDVRSVTRRSGARDRNREHEWADRPDDLDAVPVDRIEGRA